MTDTICKRLLNNVAERPHAPAYYVRERGVWKATSWADYGRSVSRAARALIKLGFEPGQTVTILGFNRPEWVILDLAAMAVGGAAAGIYTTCSPDEVAYIVRHSGCPLILVENEDQHAKVKEERGNCPELQHVVVMGGAAADEGALTWEAFLALGDEGKVPMLMEANRDPRMGELYDEYLRRWSTLTDGALFVHYGSPSLWSQWGTWGSKEYQGQPVTEAPKHQALLRYLAH